MSDQNTIAAVSDTKKANSLIALAKLNLDNCVQRRSAEWRINFALWAALGVSIAFVHERSLPLPDWVVWIAALAVFLIHGWFVAGMTISHEKDLDWMIYYRGQAEVALKHAEKENLRPRPDEAANLRYLAGMKLVRLLGPFIVTLILASVLAYVSTRAHDGPGYQDAHRHTVTIRESENGRTRTWTGVSETTSMPASEQK